ncbi:hypothetical protein QMK33_15610 [Hymenobacter sp. H14-R3]|uniref:hypothetical protein n=1 Tax=Hymenobacter sp. H14-R3 TaxID=3046308 RepID=UPI0024B9F9A8|nr:hypothetical protein [Hymenobacter sp. H14-R3]MDJ0366586.1 hypothetical protein [Hymenobacter sp. H14-R3]
MDVALPADKFACAYEPATATLRGSWAGPVAAATLPACYAQLLAMAQAHGACRFWLLDMQQRDWHDAAFAQWFGEYFVPQVSAVLGQPLFMACVVRPAQRLQVEDGRTELLLRRAAAFTIFPFYFDNAAHAHAWLRDQQTGDRSLARRAATSY